MVQTLAVLTGDIVASSALSAAKLRQLFSAHERAIAKMQSWPGAPDLLVGSRYRGDGWQLVLGKPEWALRAALFIRASIRMEDAAFETRIGVGIGGGTLDPSDIGASSGPVFERSGHSLDTLPKHFMFGIDVGNGGADSTLFHSVFVMADALSRGWTARQAEVFSFILAPDSPNQAEIGAAMRPPVSQPTVAEHYLVGNGPALLDAIEAVEMK